MDYWLVFVFLFGSVFESDSVFVMMFEMGFVFEFDLVFVFV